jgi:hypothetical protein
MITVIKEGDHLKILSSTEKIPDNVTLHLSLSEEDSWARAQLETEFRSDEDWGDSLDDLVLK